MEKQKSSIEQVQKTIDANLLLLRFQEYDSELRASASNKYTEKVKDLNKYIADLTAKKMMNTTEYQKSVSALTKISGLLASLKSFSASAYSENKDKYQKLLQNVDNLFDTVPTTTEKSSPKKLLLKNTGVNFLEQNEKSPEKELRSCLERLKKWKLDDTKIYAALLEKLENKNYTPPVVLLLAPTDWKMYDNVRDYMPFDLAYTTAIKAKIYAETGKSTFLTFKHPALKEYLAAIASSPYIDTVAMIGHGTGSDITIQERGTGNTIRETTLRESYLKKAVEDFFSQDPQWKPLNTFYKETCGDKKDKFNTFGKSFSSNTLYYKGTSNPLQHIAGYKQQKAS